MIKTGGEERRFIVYIEEALVEENIQTCFKLLCTAAFLNQSGNIVRNTQRILPRRSFIEEHVPPGSVPGAFKGDGGIGKSRFLYLGFSESDFIQPIALFITGQDKAFGTGMFIIVTPEILPISGLFQVVLVKILFSQTFGNQGDGIVTIRIFYGAVSGAGDAVGDIAEFQIGDQSATPFRFMAVAGADGCICLLYTSPSPRDA